MAKKSRRARKRSRATRPAPPARKTPSQPSSEIAKATPRSGAITGKTVDFATEYRYVYADLKRIAITAAAMLAVLIILSFVIR
jgi:hypothetical protein